MCILYSRTINSLVNKSFAYLKKRVSSLEQLNRRQKQSRAQATADQFYFYNVNNRTDNDDASELLNQNEIHMKLAVDHMDENEVMESNLGFVALKRVDYDLLSASSAHVDSLSFNLFRLEESQLDKMNESSDFYKFCELLYEKCKLNVEKCEREESKTESLSKNPRQGHKILYYFIRQFSCTLPLWTKLMLPQAQLPISVSLHDERLNAMHSLSLHDECEPDSVDSFIKRIYDESSELIQKNVEIHGANEHEFRNSHFGDYSRRSRETELAKLKRSFSSTRDTGADDLDLTQANLSKAIKIAKLSSSSGNAKKKVIEKKPKAAAANKNELLKLKQNAERHMLNSTSQPVEENEFRLICLSESDEILAARSRLFSTEDDSGQVVASVNTESEKEIVIEREQQILANKYGLELTREDLETLESFNSPNSNVIEFYLKALEEKVSGVFVCPVSFYLNLKYGQSEAPFGSGGFDADEFDLFKYSLVLVPIQKADHWALAVSFSQLFLNNFWFV